jgi:hypothetical protein
MRWGKSSEAADWAKRNRAAGGAEEEGEELDLEGARSPVAMAAFYSRLGCLQEKYLSGDLEGAPAGLGNGRQGEVVRNSASTSYREAVGSIAWARSWQGQLVAATSAKAMGRRSAVALWRGRCLPCSR